MKKIAYITVILCLLLASGSRKEYKEILVKAETIMYDHPDSALHMLEQLRDTMQNAGKADRMYYELLLADAQNKSYVDFTTDSMMKEVVRYYDRHGSANERMRAHYLLGCTYRDMGEAPMALQCYQEAVECADTSSTNCDIQILTAVYGQMSRIFHKQNLPHDEIWAIHHYINCIQHSCDKEEYIVAKGQLIRPYYLLGEKDTVLQIINDTYQTLKRLGKTKRAASILPTSIYIYLERNQLSKAKQVMDIFEHECDLFDEKGNIVRGREHYYYTKGLYELAVNKTDSAEFHFRKAIQYGYNSEGYKGLLSVYRERNNMDSVFLFSHLYETAQDSLHNKMQTDVIHQMSSLYNYNRSQKEAAQERENTRKAKEMLRTLIFLAVVLIGAISWFYYRRQQKKKEMILNLENDLGNAILIREEIQEELKRLKEKDYESVIATKEKKEAELTQAIERLRAKNELYKRKSNENNTDRLDDFLNSSIAQLFIKKANNKTERPVPSDAEWRLLESQFSKDMPAIYNSFGHDKTLSSLEQYVCILLLLKIPTNAIIMMVKSSPQTVSKAKSRANMKLFNEKSANTLENNLLSSLKRS